MVLSVRRLATASACLGLSALLVAPPGPAAALTIEIKDVAPDRVERQRRAAEGRLPLPGTPNLATFEERLANKGLKAGDPVFIRIFKAESELELWMEKDGRFVLLDTYPICHWSGTIGPKLREGDKQNPEGFYTVEMRQLRHRGRWPRSLNLGFPNAYDKVLARTGSYILVHGGCSSTGCFAMTNAVMDEIYDLTEKALKGSQSIVHVHTFPFRMTEENLARHAGSDWADFWRNLKSGYDAFEATKIPPRISVCDNRYVVETAALEEEGDAGPLAVCGGHPSADGRSKGLSPIADLPSSPPDQSSARAGLVPPARAKVPHGRADTAALPTAPYGLGASVSPPLKCNLARPSCRKLSSLRTRQQAKAVFAAERKRHPVRGPATAHKRR
jgi:murein L,D-transpeptidase YafK